MVQIQKFKHKEFWDDSNFKLLVYNNDSTFDPRLGDAVSGEGKLLPMMGLQNPCQFNYQRFLSNQNIYLTTFEDEFVNLKSNNSLIRYAYSLCRKCKSFNYSNIQGASD